MWTRTPLNLCFFSTTCTHALHAHSLTLSQETLSNTLGHQFNLSSRFSDKCDVCRKTIRFGEDRRTCTRESLYPPLLSSPFFFLLSLHFPPSPSSFLCFPSSHLTPPSSLTVCQVFVHRECVDKLDKKCSEVSEGCVGREERGHTVGGSEGVQVEDESEGTVTRCVCMCACTMYVYMAVCVCTCICVCLCVCMCTYACVCMCVCVCICIWAIPP